MIENDCGLHFQNGRRHAVEHLIELVDEGIDAVFDGACDEDDLGIQGAGKGGAPASLADYSPEDNNMAWTLGVEAKFDKFKASYAYAYIEGDAIPYFVSDSDFGAAVVPTSDTSVNVQGHKLGLAYAVSKNCSVSATAFFTELIEPSSSYDGDKGTLYQFDLSYKF